MKGSNGHRERGVFTEHRANTVRLTACRAGDRVADSEKEYLNFLFAPMAIDGGIYQRLYLLQQIGD